MKPFTLSLLTLMSAAIATTSVMAEPGQGNWLIRGRVISVDPTNTGGQSDIGGKPKAKSQAAPELDVTYFLNDRMAFELIAATTKHTTSVAKKPTTTSLGDVWVLPPTLTAQYHHQLGAFKPYVGIGVTYAHFYNAEHPGLGSVKYDDSFGPAFQVGLDYEIAPNVYLNADVKQLLISTDVTVNDTIKAKANLNPTVWGLGVGYRF